MAISSATLAQSDALKDDCPLLEFSVHVYDTLPEHYQLTKHASGYDWEIDSIKAGNAMLYKVHNEFDDSYVSIYKENKWTVWLIQYDYGNKDLSIDTVTLNKKKHATIRWKDGDGRWWWNETYMGLIIIDLDTPKCIFCMGTYYVKFTADAEDRYSESVITDDCHCEQEAYFSRDTLIIKPVNYLSIIADGFASEDNCKIGKTPGKYLWNGVHWRKQN